MKRKIVGRTRYQEEHASQNGRTFRWWAISIHTVTLECGHKKTYRGDSCPAKSADCKECDAQVRELVVEHFDDRNLVKQAAKSGAQ